MSTTIFATRFLKCEVDCEALNRVKGTFSLPLSLSLLVGFDPTMANTRKAAAKSGSTIDNELRSPTNLDFNAINSTTMEKMLMSHLISLQETINKLGEEVRALIKRMLSSKLLSLRMKILRKWLQNLKIRFKNPMSALTRLN